MKRHYLVLSALLMSGLVSAAPAGAAWLPSLLPPAKPIYSVDAGWRMQEAGRIGAKEAARLAREAFGGRVLAVRREVNKHRWRVRLLRDGEVFVVFVDSRNGRVWR